MSSDKYSKAPDNFKTTSDVLSKAVTRSIESRDLYAALAMHALLHQGIPHELACVQAWEISNKMVRHGNPV